MYNCTACDSDIARLVEFVCCNAVPVVRGESRPAPDGLEHHQLRDFKCDFDLI